MLQKDKLTPLICSPTSEDYDVLRSVKDKIPELVTAFKLKKKTDSEKYQEGKYIDTFDYVIFAFMKETSGEDLGMYEDFL